MGIIDPGAVVKAAELARKTALRVELEGPSLAFWPRKTTRRAICYAAKIYNFATDGGTMELDKIDLGLWQVSSGSEGVKRSMVELTAERAYSYVPTAAAMIARGERALTLKDTRPGLVIVSVEGKTRRGEWRQTYVVFRGSRGAVAGSKGNKLAAGWTAGKEGEQENVDWTADFDNEQVKWPYGGVHGDVEVHRGFLSIYRSLRDTILSKLRGMDTDEIIVTGHSLGGGLTTLCSYDLRQEMPDATVVCLSFNAPRAGNEAFARDFNRSIAEQTFTSVMDDGSYRQSHRFVQAIDPVSKGMMHASKYNYVSDYKALPADRRVDLSERTIAGKLGGSGRRDAELEKKIQAGTTASAGGGAIVLMKESDETKPYYHVKNAQWVSLYRGGMHSFTGMLDSIAGGGTAAKLGIHADPH